ncbi:PQQ-binding-like beta-propeller repeat protein [Streptomyces sp. WMMB303]|uniref:outer membrane protein assembly factor BamB family protein n=1 Tax=Streptomyces sp. WMMB303 TaxID=3034154 RepID=UPI0023EDD258|nr:PQQ-binding-like beta-propeller repeat protein [Streptomyces sp. WMMB303]MDF4252510.1 PQQ-binding-like beta-propeller repeat protein [Streptomyces sp. WMMB303]
MPPPTDPIPADAPTPSTSPQILGGYSLVERLDTESDGICRWLALASDGLPTIVIAPEERWCADSAYRQRFWAEAKNSQRLAGRWDATIARVSPAGSLKPWISYDCGPALPLDTALSVNGGPLEEVLVGSLATALAEALWSAHTRGLVYAGISTRSVLLTRTGPVLTGYGLVRAAAVEGADRRSVPGVDEASLPPEQRTGGRPLPAGDVHALASVLLRAMPEGQDWMGGDSFVTLSEVAHRCLAADPARRPDAGEVLREFRSLTSGSGFTLPKPVAVALDEQAARAFAHPGSGSSTGRSEQPTPARPPRTVGPRSRYSSRRLVLTAALPAAAGLVVGAGGALGWRSARDQERPDMDRIPRGVAPAPLWRRKSSVIEPSALAVVDDSTVISGAGAGADGLVAFDVRTGRKLWEREDIASSRLLDMGEGWLLTSADGDGRFSLVSTRTGVVKWHERRYTGNGHGHLSMAMVLGSRNGVLFFMAADRRIIGEEKFSAVAYRIRDRKELWRTPVPDGFGDYFVLPGGGAAGPALSGSTLLLANTGVKGSSKGDLAYLALDLRSGRRKWRRTYEGVGKGAGWLALPMGEDLLVVAGGGSVRGLNPPDGRERWRLPVSDAACSGSAVGRGTLYVGNADSTIYAVDARQGKQHWHWKQSAGEKKPFVVSGMMLSASGRTLFRSSPLETEAFDTRDGAPRWRLAMAHSAVAGRPGVPVASATGVVLVTTDDSLYALPVD